MLWVGSDLKDHLGPHQTRLLTALFSLAWNTSRDGASTASLGNLFQCLTTLSVKNFLLVSDLNLEGSLYDNPLIIINAVRKFFETFCVFV